MLATVVRLLDKTLIRVGNDEYARENNSFGLTTLRRRHVKVSGTAVALLVPRQERHRARRGLHRCAPRPHHPALPGHARASELFQYVDAEGERHAITSDDVNAHLREITGRDVTAKDFRTWGGTMHAALALQSMGPAASRREADRNILQALEVVCKRLGNTRTVCRKYYVHPALIEAYLMGQTVRLPATRVRPHVRRHREAALRRDEVAVLQFLQERLD